MSIGFIELSSFTKRIVRTIDDDVLATVQCWLMRKPDAGAVMPGCGGLRKLRVVDPRRQKGKRGGQRIIYFHVPEYDLIYLIDIYGKDEKDDVSAEDKKHFRSLARRLEDDAKSGMIHQRE